MSDPKLRKGILTVKGSALIGAETRIETFAVERSMSQMGHVWTAPGWQGLFSRFAALVGAAMCPAF
jgi:hypothetical protein